MCTFGSFASVDSANASVRSVISFPLPFVAFILAAALLLQSCGQLCILVSVRMVARIEAKALVGSTISPQRCTRVIVNRATQRTAHGTIVWKEENEFVLGESMFDVLHRYDSSDVTVIVAVRDGADSWWHTTIGREQDSQSRRRTTSGPVERLLAQLASVKAVTSEIILHEPPTKSLRGDIIRQSEPLRSGHRTLIDRPPLMA